MVIGCRHHVLQLLLAPVYAGLALALWAMAIATGMIAQLVKLTLIAVHELPAESFSAAQADVAADRMLGRTQAMVLLVVIQETVEHVLHRGTLIHHTPPGL
jgi:hypothetical protein